MIDYNTPQIPNGSGADLPFTNFVRTPFMVEALVITDENIDLVARMVGTVKVKKDEKYISLDRRVIPNISRAYIGWYLTRLGDNLRCYSPKVFAEQFEPMPDTMIVHFDFSSTKDEDPGFVEATEDTLNQITFE